MENQFQEIEDCGSRAIRRFNEIIQQFNVTHKDGSEGVVLCKPNQLEAAKRLLETT